MLFASQFKFHVLGTYLYLLTKKNSQVQWDSSVYFSRLAFTSRYALDLISMVWIFASISAYFYLVSKILTCLFEVCGYRNVNFFSYELVAAWVYAEVDAWFISFRIVLFWLIICRHFILLIYSPIRVSAIYIPSKFILVLIFNIYGTHLIPVRTWRKSIFSNFFFFSWQRSFEAFFSLDALDNLRAGNNHSSNLQMLIDRKLASLQRKSCWPQTRPNIKVFWRLL